jgi:hypothetical protein
MENRFNIDFFEFSFLVEACIPPVPIARHSFWISVINTHYHKMTQGERDNLYNWINLNYGYKKGLEDKNEECMLFEARFKPGNQYNIETNYMGKVETHNCFKYNDEYWVSTRSRIAEEYITKVEQIL